jgi:hypothetical protein
MVLAKIPDVFGPNMTAEMTYYETGERSAFSMAGTIWFPVIRQIVENL